MKCPECKETELFMVERQNIEIDYCPQWRSVWLDRDEPDKMIERAAALRRRMRVPRFGIRRIPTMPSASGRMSASTVIRRKSAKAS